MKRVKIFHVSLMCVVALFALANTAAADEPQKCFEQRDKACLEKLYKDVVTNPTPQALDAIYLLGQLELEDKNFEQASKQFEMGVMFGDTERSVAAKADLLKSGKIDVEPMDCTLFDNPEKCILDIAENKPDKRGVAYYYLAETLAKSDPDRSAKYTIKAAENGHGTSECLLAFGYANEKASGPSVLAGFVPKLKKDYEKARYWGEKCGFGPYRGYNKKHFAGYLKREDHKAYAVYLDKGGIYSEGSATPEIAASIAGELCSIYFKRKPTDPPCRVMNVDGEWVDYFDAPALPKRTGSPEDILTLKGRKSYEEAYINAPNPKAFVQGPIGNWYWYTRQTDETLDEVKVGAIKVCQNGWMFNDYGSACEIVNVNGEWIK